MKYVALVRGINVGGNHRVPKAEFKKVLENLGFSDVLIYLNSGNAVFSSSQTPKASDVQAALENYFGFSIPTLILSASKIKAIAAAIPSDWTNDKPQPDKSGQKSDVLYLFDDINAPDILQRLAYRPEIETMVYVDGAVLANVTRLNQGKSSILKLIGTELYKSVTIRNINTAKMLAELVQ